MLWSSWQQAYQLRRPLPSLGANRLHKARHLLRDRLADAPAPASMYAACIHQHCCSCAVQNAVCTVIFLVVSEP